MQTQRRVSLLSLSFVSLFATLPAQKVAELKESARDAFQSQEWPAAEKALTKLVEIDAKDASSWYQLGYVLHAQQKYDGALKAHLKAASFKDNPQACQLGCYNAACVYAIRGEKDAAFEWIDKSIEAGFSRAGHLETDTDMDNLRKDPRFAKVLERMRENGGAAPQRAFSGTTSRQSTRVAYFGGRTSGGQFAIDYAAVPWRESYADALTNEKFLNRRWRFGANFWTNLDTNIPLTIAGKKFAPGLYYLTLEHKGEGKMVMNVLDPVKVRKARLDPSVAHRTTGGVDVELTSAKVEKSAEKLSIKVAVGKYDNTSGELTIRFGPHKLTAPLKIHLAK